MTDTQARPQRLQLRWPLWLLGGLVFLGIGAGVGWAATSVLSPAEDVLDATAFTYVEVAPGEVGSSINLNTVAAWTPVLAGANRASGVVTAIAIAPGDEVTQGSVLYSVNLRPVVVAQGAVPAFRDIGQDAAGPDVAQAQEMLTALGFYGGVSDGKAGSRTVVAIKAWQKSSGLDQSGTIQLGDVIFVPALPTRVSLDTEVITRGASLTGGEEVVRSLASAPAFVVPVTEAQAAMMPVGTLVEITGPENSAWTAYVVDQVADPEIATISVNLQGADGAPICADKCGLIPVTGESRLASKIVTVATVQGLVVPSAALVTGADGQTAVIDTEGERVPVVVGASARGMSVVEGVSEGTRVRIPATETP